MRDKEVQIQVKIGSEPAQIIDFDSYRVPASEKVAHTASNVALDRIKKYAVIE